MPSSKGHATRGGGAQSKKNCNPQNIRTLPTGLWQQSLIPKPSQNFTLCEPGKYLEYGDEMRLQCEALFCMPVNIKLFNSWQRSEEHWYRKDREMLEYLQDFPLKDWLIPLAQARAAYEAMQERFRLRDEGKSIYTHGIPIYDPYNEIDVDISSSKASTSEGEESDGPLEEQDYHVKQSKVSSPREPCNEQFPAYRQHRDSAVVTDMCELKPLPETSPGVSWRKLDVVSVEPVQPRVYPPEQSEFTTAAQSKPSNTTIKADVTAPESRKASVAITDISDAEICIPTRDNRPEEPRPLLKYQSASPTKHDVPSSSNFVPINSSLPVDTVPTARKRKAHSISEDQIVGGHEKGQSLETRVQQPEAWREPPAKETAVDRRTMSPDTDHQRRKLISKLSKTEILAPPYDRDPSIPQRHPNFDFPWQNDWAGEDPEEWDDSIYDPARLEHIRRIHAINSRVVNLYMENGKHGAQKRKSAAMLEIKTEPGTCQALAKEEVLFAAQAALKTNKRRQKMKRTRGSDQRDHFSGRLHFADEAQEAKFNALPYLSIEDAIKAAMENPFDEALKEIEVAHDPGDSLLDNLQLPRVSIMDIARTRLQLQHVRVFTDRAAECLIDFCPDLLTNYQLLQVVSETKFSNTQVQIRLGHNGSMLSDSTITKRVSAALNREYDKRGAAEAARKNPEFKKTNRDMYAKYKAWRAQKRQTGVQERYSQFILIESARQHKEQQDQCPAEARHVCKTRPALRPIEPASSTVDHASSEATSHDKGKRCLPSDNGMTSLGNSSISQVDSQTECTISVETGSVQTPAAKQVMISSSLVPRPDMSYPISDAEASKAVPSEIDNLQPTALAQCRLGKHSTMDLKPQRAYNQKVQEDHGQIEDVQRQHPKIARVEGQRSIHDFFSGKGRKN